MRTAGRRGEGGGMDTTQNKALICRFIDEYQTGADERALQEFVHPDVVDHSRPPGISPGIEGVRDQFDGFLRVRGPSYVVSSLRDPYTAPADANVPCCVCQDTHDAATMHQANVTPRTARGASRVHLRHDAPTWVEAARYTMSRLWEPPVRLSAYAGWYRSVRPAYIAWSAVER